MPEIILKCLTNCSLLTIDDARDASPGPNQGPVDAADDAGPDAAQGLVNTPEYLTIILVFLLLLILLLLPRTPPARGEGGREGGSLGAGAPGGGDRTGAWLTQRPSEPRHQPEGAGGLFLTLWYLVVICGFGKLDFIFYKTQDILPDAPLLRSYYLHGQLISSQLNISTNRAKCLFLCFDVTLFFTGKVRGYGGYGGTEWSGRMHTHLF